MVSPAVFPVLLVFVTVILLALSQLTRWPNRPFPQNQGLFGVLCSMQPMLVPATVRGSGHRATSGLPIGTNWTLHAAAQIRNPAGPRSSRESRGRGRDPLRNHRAVVGRDVRTPWYVPIRSLIVLLLIVIGLGMAFAGITLLIIASGRFLLEILAG